MNPVTRYTNFPHNISIFYPEIWGKLAPMAASDGFKACYPTVCDLFDHKASIGTIMRYIEAHQIEPVMPK